MSAFDPRTCMVASRFGNSESCTMATARVSLAGYVVYTGITTFSSGTMRKAPETRWLTYDRASVKPNLKRTLLRSLSVMSGWEGFPFAYGYYVIDCRLQVERLCVSTAPTQTGSGLLRVCASPNEIKDASMTHWWFVGMAVVRHKCTTR